MHHSGGGVDSGGDPACVGTGILCTFCSVLLFKTAFKTALKMYVCVGGENGGRGGWVAYSVVSDSL